LPPSIPVAWRPPEPSAPASDSPDLIRAVRAAAVMVGHLRAFFSGTSSVCRRNPGPGKLPIFLLASASRRSSCFSSRVVSSYPRPSSEVVPAESGRDWTIESVARSGSRSCLPRVCGRDFSRTAWAVGFFLPRGFSRIPQAIWGLPCRPISDFCPNGTVAAAFWGREPF
jgi:hypothetical protein